jgi:hypothetical protein
VSEKFAWQMTAVFAPFVMWNPLIVAPVAPTVGNVTCGYVVWRPRVVLYSDWAPHVAVASAWRA